MTKKAKKAKKAPPRGRRATLQSALLAAGGHPDQRFPVHNDPTHEILCKWIDNRTQCRQVATGEDWDPLT
jgi:hypothetical protein